MEQYYFLFALAFLWTIFAVAQDLKKREVANWLNFSLIAFALSYRFFYSLSYKETAFFFTGLAGFVIFFVLAHAFYYMKIFAGGDAKLLMGFGIILPYASFSEFLPIALIFIFVLFFLGSIYSIIYSIFIVVRNWKKFSLEFTKRVGKSVKPLIIFLVPMLLIMVFYQLIGLALITLTLVVLLLHSYFKALDICMNKLLSPKELQEGDWLEKEVRIGNTLIKKSVHGLSMNDIKLLRKSNKKVLIKEGIPFTPAFLLALITTAPFFLISGFHLAAFSPILSSLPFSLFFLH